MDETMWRARIVDVMNPMGALVSHQIRNSGVVHFHACSRDALFLAAWKNAIHPNYFLSLNVNSRVVLQLSLEKMMQMALNLIDHSTRDGEDPMIGSARKRDPVLTFGCLNCHGECLEARLREEVLYFFGILSALRSRSPLSVKIKTFEYLAAVVGQKDEFLPMAVEEHLGPKMRSVFEFLCSLHYFQSNSRQNSRISHLMSIENQLQEMCAQENILPWDAHQRADFYCEAPSSNAGVNSQIAVVLLPSALSSGDEPEKKLFLQNIGGYLNDGFVEFFFTDSFHHRLRWMERLSRARQLEQIAAMHRDPLRVQPLMDSRSGRQKVVILAPESLSFLRSFINGTIFPSLSLALQEIIQTSVDLDDVRQKEQWGTPPLLDFISLVEALALRSGTMRFDGLLKNLNGGAIQTFLEATLRLQEIDSPLCERLLSQSAKTAE